MQHRVRDQPAEMRRPVAAPAAAIERKASLDDDGDREQRRRRDDAGTFLERATQKRAGDLSREIVEVEVREARDARDGKQRGDNPEADGRCSVQIGVDRRRSHRARIPARLSSRQSTTGN